MPSLTFSLVNANSLQSVFVRTIHYATLDFAYALDSAILDFWKFIINLL